MKTDLYTKTILTVIAVCLTVNLLKEFEVIPSAQANTTVTAPNPIPAPTQSNVVDVNITHIAGTKVVDNSYKSYFNLKDGLPVQIQKNNDK